MSEAINAQILQAITELSQQMGSVEKELNLKIDTLNGDLSSRIEKVELKVDKMDTKLSILSDGLLSTQADVKMLKNDK